MRRIQRLPISLSGALIVAATILVLSPPASAQADAAAGIERAQVLAGPHSHGVGRRVRDFDFTDLEGRSETLAGLTGSGAAVIVVRDEGCPLSRKYAPRLARLEAEYASRGAVFLFLNLAAQDPPAAMAEARKKYGFRGPYVADPQARIGRELGARTTTEVFVIDAAQTLRYRGAVDDQHGVGFSRPAPDREFLRAALDAVLRSEPPAVAATSAPGCLLELPTASAPATETTWNGEISRIVQANCLQCHQRGSVAPFALESYEQVTSRAAMIRYVVEEELMPPWGAAHGTGPWSNDRSLEAGERRELLSWLAGDRAEGDPAHAPLPLPSAPQWQIGEPDAIVTSRREFTVPAEGVLDYRYDYVQTDFGEDKWIQAVEILPSAPEVVHHALIFIEEPRRPDESRREHGRRFQGGLEGYFAGIVPGQGATVWPTGLGRKLPAGAWLKLQLHYTPNGTEQRDRTRIAFRFATQPPEHEVRVNSVANVDFRIPAGEADHVVRASARFSKPATLLAVSPHMHLRGKSFRYELVYPDGRQELLLDVPRYDFNWQTMYRLAEPLEVPGGTRLVCTAHFDNSADNPANPDPTRTVGFGEQTWDEMMIGYFEWWRDADAADAGSR